ncbi:MAG: TrkH family potassium uptake protein [Candidatus Omnitrophica bacterium]|nr:TrkH family potassium uptake protein [Candidatus Omnitrophota bacterium]
MFYKRSGKSWRGSAFSPEGLLLGSFLLAIIAGMFLLKLPLSSVHGALRWIDALFLSTSAFCVTGLSVIDVGRDLTVWGKIFLLLFIQIGGLGIMTFSLFFYFFFNVRIPVANRLSIGAMTNKIDTRTLGRVLFFVVSLTLTVELCGALLLYTHFLSLHPPLHAFFSAIFHAVSAFNNAGFSLYSDSLMVFQRDFFVQAIIMSLIIMGGLGFIVMREAVDQLLARRSKRKNFLSVHSKTALTGTLFLIVTGTILFWGTEQNLCFRGMGFPWQVLNAMFLAVTARTAGFNTVDIGALSGASLIVLIVLMLIGGCSGSTAGGMKVNTIGVLAAFIRQKLTGEPMARLFNRKIPQTIIDRALIVFFMFLFFLVIAVFVLEVTEMCGVGCGTDGFVRVFFEMVSAFGTVGLSTGITAQVTDGGKLVLIFLMFLGRVGPLSLVVLLLSRRRKKAAVEFVEEDVLVG